jgi:hypothetical protein
VFSQQSGKRDQEIQIEAPKIVHCNTRYRDDSFLLYRWPP